MLGLPENDLEKYTREGLYAVDQVLRHKMVLRLVETCRGPLLDCGCGLGDITYRLSKQFDKVAGVDISPERVAWAQKEFGQDLFQVCGENRLDFPDASFGTVTSIVVANWIADLDAYIEEIKRVLKPGGKLVMAARAPAYYRFEGRPAKSENSQAENEFQPYDIPLKRMAEILTRHGFKVECLDSYYPQTYEEKLSFREMARDLFLYVPKARRVHSLARYYGMRAALGGG